MFFFRNISTNCTRPAMTRMKATVCMKPSPRLYQQELIDGVAQGGGQTHHEGHGCAHTDSGVDLLGHAHKGADAQKLGEDKVIGQDSAKGDGQQF